MFSRKIYCPRCDNKLKREFDFCPQCGLDIRNPQKDAENYGILGKNEMTNAPFVGNAGGMGIADKMIGAIFNSLVKTLEKQMRGMEDTEVQQSPNGLTIRVGPANAKKQKVRNGITAEQIKRMTGLPRVEAKTNMKRLSDKIVYELKAPGIANPEDVFISKLASGYEVRAIGKNKVYMNSLPVELPLKGFALDENGLHIEFSTN